MIFFVIGATFTDPLTCWFLVLSFVVTPHIHLISFTSSLFPSLFVVDHTCIFPVHNAMQALPLFCISFPLASRAIFYHTTLHCTSSNFPMLYSPYVLSSKPYLRSLSPIYLKLITIFNSCPAIFSLSVYPFRMFEPTFHPLCFWYTDSHFKLLWRFPPPMILDYVVMSTALPPQWRIQGVFWLQPPPCQGWRGGSDKSQDRFM